jgi:hypothetical protein
MTDKKPKTARLWAITKKGRLVAMDEGSMQHLQELLIFKTKWRAYAAMRDDEEVVRMDATFRTR